MRMVAAPDKFRGTARASEIAGAIAEAAATAGWACNQIPIADGGEGLLDVFGGANRSTQVRRPDHSLGPAPWRFDHGRAIIEMSAASGLDLAGGSDHNDAVEADTSGTGDLIVAAVEEGARRIIVGLGGSASTDGGLGAVRAVGSAVRLKGIELVAAYDVDIAFGDAARLFAPQKGASPAEAKLLERRLARTAQLYRDEFDVDVGHLAGAGAAGGLGGGLAALGATLVSGFELVAEEVDLATTCEGANLIVTGEGFVDEGSYAGKAVGGVVDMAAALDIPVLVVAGDVFDGVGDRAPTLSLVEMFGEERSHSETMACVRDAVLTHLQQHHSLGVLS